MTIVILFWFERTSELLRKRKCEVITLMEEKDFKFNELNNMSSFLLIESKGQ